MTAFVNSRASNEVIAGHPANIWRATRAYVQGRRGLYALLAVTGIGLALGGAWWGFVAILPLLYFLSCAAMLAMCMKGRGGSGGNATAPSDPTPVSIDNKIVD
jgi:hypothetical protein